MKGQVEFVYHSNQMGITSVELSKRFLNNSSHLLIAGCYLDSNQPLTTHWRDSPSRKSKQAKEHREQSKGFLRPRSRGRKAMWVSNVFNGYHVFFTSINKRIPPPPKMTSSRRDTGEKFLLPCTICKSLLAVTCGCP